MTKITNEMFQQMQKKVLKTMKEISKASENVFEKIAKKIMILNEIVI